MNKDLKRIVRALEADGYDVAVNRRGHPEVSRGGQRITTFAGTPSDPRSLKNSLAPLKRMGFCWPPQR